MASTAELRARVMEFDESEAITDRRLLKLAALVLALVMVAFVMARPLGLESGTIGMAGAALLLRRDVMASVGPLDERFAPAWFEDVDYCRRIAATGVDSRTSAAASAAMASSRVLVPPAMRKRPTASFVTVRLYPVSAYQRIMSIQDTSLAGALPHARIMESTIGRTSSGIGVASIFCRSE